MTLIRILGHETGFLGIVAEAPAIFIPAFCCTVIKDVVIMTNPAHRLQQEAGKGRGICQAATHSGGLPQMLPTAVFPLSSPASGPMRHACTSIHICGNMLHVHAKVERESKEAEGDKAVLVVATSRDVLPYLCLPCMQSYSFYRRVDGILPV